MNPIINNINTYIASPKYAPNIIEPIANKIKKILFDIFIVAQTKLNIIINK